MIILGIHFETSHDSGVAIIKDGKILFAANEERFSRIKGDNAAPYKSLKEALRFTQIKPSDIDIVAFSGSKPGILKIAQHFYTHNSRVWFTHFGYLKSFYTLKSFDWIRFLRQSGWSGLIGGINLSKNTIEVIQDLKDKGFNKKVIYIDHDKCHAASAFYTSGYKKSFVAVVEGSSLTNSCSFWLGDGNSIKKIGSVPVLHSPGRFYELVTRILGFHYLKHSGKITGLAAFGNYKKCYSLVRKLMWTKGRQIRVSPQMYSLTDDYFGLNEKTPEPFKSYSREDVASAFQKGLEDVILDLFKNYARDFDMTNVSLAGGVFANVKLNGEICKLKSIKKMYVFPGMGDVGQALGAALAAYARTNHNFEPFLLENVYLGPSYSDSEVRQALKKYKIKYRKAKKLSQEVAKIIADNKVIALFQGRMEFGPRALGNRSILYPAIDKSVNTWLNERLNRTEFMPFAPVTLFEYAKDCYERPLLDKCLKSAEFMTIALPVTKFMQRKMPAAVHIDNTARPQIIEKSKNNIYYQILDEYRKITGLPSLINTSFNMHEEPIICTPEEAIIAFRKSGIDYLIMNKYIIQRTDS